MFFAAWFFWATTCGFAKFMTIKEVWIVILTCFFYHLIFSKLRSGMVKNNHRCLIMACGCLVLPGATCRFRKIFFTNKFSCWAILAN